MGDQNKPEPISTYNDHTSCGRSKFTCDNGAKCLPLTWLCDSIDDCVDRKDEHNCPVKKTRNFPSPSGRGSGYECCPGCKASSSGRRRTHEKRQRISLKSKKSNENSRCK